MIKAWGYYYGKKIIAKGESINDWTYEDGSPIDKDNPPTCPRCKEKPTKEGHDHCLSTLPGVKYACCGHGVDEGYIMFNNGLIIRGHFKKD